MLKMGHVQDPPVSTNMISIVCMIYHTKVQIFGYNLGPPKMSKSKIHTLTISEPISMKPAIVPHPCSRKLRKSQPDTQSSIRKDKVHIF